MSRRAFHVGGWLLAATIGIACLLWFTASHYQKRRFLELVGWPVAPSSSVPTTLAPKYAAEPADLERLCQHFGNPSGASECLAHFARIAQYDGESLWLLRRDCMLLAADLFAAQACNGAVHPEWPKPES